MLLKKSNVYRRGGSGATQEIDAECHNPGTGAKDMGFALSFDMGTAAKREKLAVFIHNSDFALLASLMIEANRDAAIQAFGKALAKSKPQD
ncbi:hypothetical protein [Agrobacterium sp. El2ro-1b]|uniref:hypothetical protein n=1 Tax=Agrobacterium sp. El2ro-1b TaxID=2969528 RepID=UPI000DDA5EDD